MKTAEPVKGVCKWLADEVNGCRRLLINDRVYEVEHGWNLFRLHTLKAGEIVTYTIDTTSALEWRCDCPDATNRVRPGGCKHTKAIRAAVARRPY